MLQFPTRSCGGAATVYQFPLNVCNGANASYCSDNVPGACDSVQPSHGPTVQPSGRLTGQPSVRRQYSSAPALSRRPSADPTFTRFPSQPPSVSDATASYFALSLYTTNQCSADSQYLETGTLISGCSVIPHNVTVPQNGTIFLSYKASCVTSADAVLDYYAYSFFATSNCTGASIRGPALNFSSACVPSSQSPWLYSRQQCVASDTPWNDNSATGVVTM